MAANKEFTLQEIAEHNTKKDLYLIVHDKVYDCTSFVDEHPGGEEVLLDVGGQDSTEAFEDVGHSDEAREILDGLLIGTVKRVPGDPAPRPKPTSSSSAPSSAAASSNGFGVYAILVVGAAIAYGAYQYLQAGAQQQ
ncbi:cytochrome b5-like heme/steroid binding domain-containing protein [Aspergillus clavatus NRRL 1]|uniref:Cytochrome b5, putative n=1 Tax=Aspergillus clavatus (strain ATCC 1007 / CBS 513.65 / DSM 816 / NCTC 3887 / NRRL 1 / QM 1276 / 107) TaxID=344612 RepID=A1CEK3_ASPCL|nr:cytochrome b5, putative [Aspergillus clavatus NRRL 1]EAW11302.1 cytochrome b5, putative [Aspergillus clavatus NRRL 1]